MDGNYPEILKGGIARLERVLRNILLACLALDDVPTFWPKVKVVFLSKHGRDDYSKSKNFKQISLPPFSLQCLERLSA